jgi:hypothetical protein
MGQAQSQSSGTDCSECYGGGIGAGSPYGKNSLIIIGEFSLK